MTILKRVAVGLAVLLVVAVAGGFLLFTGAAKLVASRERPPHLELHPEVAGDVVYHTLDGAERHLAATKGKVVFLDLWGTWCLQCVAEMPTVQKLYDHYRNDPRVEFLIVSRLDSPLAVRAYARTHGYDLPFYVMNDADIPPNMMLQQFPSTFLYAPDGRMVSTHVGAADWSDAAVIDVIDRLERQPPRP